MAFDYGNGDGKYQADIERVAGEYDGDALADESTASLAQQSAQACRFLWSDIYEHGARHFASVDMVDLDEEDPDEIEFFLETTGKGDRAMGVIDKFLADGGELTVRLLDELFEGLQWDEATDHPSIGKVIDEICDRVGEKLYIAVAANG